MDAQPTTPAQLTTEGSLRNTTQGDTGLLSEEDATVLAIGAAIGAAITLIVVAIIATAIKQCPATQSQGNLGEGEDSNGDIELESIEGDAVVVPPALLAQLGASVERLLDANNAGNGHAGEYGPDLDLENRSPSPASPDTAADPAFLAQLGTTVEDILAKNNTKNGHAGEDDSDAATPSNVSSEAEDSLEMQLSQAMTEAIKEAEEEATQSASMSSNDSHAPVFQSAADANPYDPFLEAFPPPSPDSKAAEAQLLPETRQLLKGAVVAEVLDLNLEKQDPVHNDGDSEIASLMAQLENMEQQLNTIIDEFKGGPQNQPEAAEAGSDNEEEDPILVALRAVAVLEAERLGGGAAKAPEKMDGENQFDPPKTLSVASTPVPSSPAPRTPASSPKTVEGIQRSPSPASF